MLIPHPDSKVPVQTFSLSSEAEVLGQVVAVAMRLVPPPGKPSPELVPKLPKPAEIEKMKNRRASGEQPSGIIS